MPEPKQKIVAKLIRIYEKIDHVEKAGHNKSQGYDYVRAADVVRMIRAAFIEEKIYAEINFEFVDPAYTIARAKEPGAPFSAVNIRCRLVFHDQESGETMSGSALGTGADTSDKAVYKAMTGCLKYALKNAALLPDEADPEADESVDEAARPSYDSRAPRPSVDPPDFQEAQRATPRPQPPPAPTPAPAPAPAAPPAACIPGTPIPVAPPTPAPANAPAPQELSPLPTEEDMKAYRNTFKLLGDDLTTEGKLKSSRGLPVNRKILVYLLYVTGATDAKALTKAQWEQFFAHVNGMKAQADGLKKLAALIEQVNSATAKK
jgi:hypothetical protein